MVRKKDTSAQKEMKMYLADGYTLAEETEYSFLMKKNVASFRGHFWVCFFTVWFSYGLVNLMYHFISYRKVQILK